MVILAGTLGYREKSKGPKVLHIHEGLSVLENQARAVLHTFPKAHISVTAGFQADKIIRFKPDFVSVIENQLWETHNTLEEVRLYLNSVKTTRVLFIDGAVLFNPHSLGLTQFSSAYCYEDEQSGDVGVYVENGNIINFSFGLPIKFGNLLYLEGRELDIFKKICTRENSKLCLFEALNILIDRKCIIRAFSSEKQEVFRI